MRKLKFNSMRYIACLLILTMAVFSLAGCKNKKSEEKPKEKKELENVILTMDDKEYTLQDLMYILYAVESQHNNEALNYQLQGGNLEDYWNEQGDEDGKTIRELTKDAVIETAKMILVQEQLAKAEGYTLNDEELAEVDDDVQIVLDNMKDDNEYLKRTGFNKDRLTELVKQFNLANKYYNDQLAKIKVDDTDLGDDLDPEAYAQVEVEYLYFSTGEMDNEGNYHMYDAEKVSEILKKAQAAYKEIADGADFQELGDKYFTEEYTVDSGIMPLYKNNEDTEENLYNGFKDLKVGELCKKVIEVNDGYYIIRLINDNCTEAYDEAVSEERTNAQATKYEEEFSKTLATHKFVLNEENWAKVNVGNYAYPVIFQAGEDDNVFEEDNDDGDVIYPENTGDGNGDDGAVG